jgi:nucleotide-binding universal stress UspA family protein
MTTLPPRVLLHPTTLSAQESLVSACATALALRSHASLTTMHASPNGGPELITPASALLEAWGHPGDAIQHDRRVEYCCDDITETLLNRAHALKPDLIVMGTHHQTHWQRLMRGSIAQRVVADMSAPTLILPLDHEELLDPATGEIDLRTVLVAAADLPSLRRAGPWASWLAGMSMHPTGRLKAIHVGEGGPEPYDCLTPAGWRWELVSVPASRASIEDEIVRAVEEAGPGSLLVMPTHGEDSIHDILFGTHAERVLERLNRPMLVLPY